MNKDENKKELFSDEDEFWSLDALLPKKEKQNIYDHSGITDTETVEMEIGEEGTVKEGEKIPKRNIGEVSSDVQNKTGDSFEKWLDRRREFEKNRYTYGKTVISEYVPDNPLIKKVTISVESVKRMSTERFLSDAMHLKDEKGDFHGNVPFESYYPQYYQLDEKQKECYIGFRTCVLNGVFPEVDRSYIYLFLYETVNLSEILPKDKAERISLLICNYPECDRKLFSDMCNWLADVCLIYREKIPDRIFGDIYPDVLENASVKEFYLFGSESSPSSGERALMLTAGKYDYRKSRFYSENKAYFDKYVPEAVCFVINELSKKDHRFSGDGAELCTLIHDSYFGALCTAAARKTIAIECLCLTRSELVKKTVTDLIKYAENCLRTRLGIKHKLTTGYLSLEMKDMLKKYFAGRASEFPSQSVISAKKIPEVIPEYEKFYEPEENGISFEKAKEIEESSWSVTEKLVSAFEDDPVEEEIIEEDVPKEKTNPVHENEDIVLSGLKALLSGNQTEFSNTAEKANMFPGALYEKINGWSLENDGICDIILTESSGVYEIIPDYYDIVKKLTENI